MGIINKVKHATGIGKTKEEKLAENVKQLSDSFPETPDETYRCDRCGEVKRCLSVGNTGIKRKDNGEIGAAVFCEDCSNASP